MKILQNDEEVSMIFAMQGEANIDNIKFEIKLSDLNIEIKDEENGGGGIEVNPKPINKKSKYSFNIDNLLTIIQFEDDFLTNIPGTNINLEIKDEYLIVNWLIGKAMTLEAKDRKFQVIIKNKKTGEIFKSYKTIFKVQKKV